MSYIPTVWKRGDIVSSEKLNKLEQGVADATSESIIVEETDAWLEENIAQETGYVLDSALTMSNAAAPADKVGELKTALNQLSHAVIGNNLLDKSKAVTGALVNKAGYVDTTGSYSSYLTSDYIPVEAEQTYTIYLASSSGLATNKTRIIYVIFDGEKTGQTIANESNVNTLSITPSTNGYVRVSVTNTTQYPYFNNYLMVVKGTTYIGYEDYHCVVYLSDNINPINTILGATLDGENVLRGKKWVHCGDSFSFYTNATFSSGIFSGKDKTFPRIIAERNNMTLLEQFMSSGRTLAYPIDGTFTNSTTCPTNNGYYQNIPLDVDYITIMLGINDCQHTGSSSTSDGEDATGEIELGTIDDDTTATYFGAYNVVLDWIRENRPFAHVGIIVTNGTELQNYTEAQIAIANKWGYPCINLNGDEKTPAMLRCYNENIPSEIKQIIKEKQAVDYSGTETGTVNMHPNYLAHEYESDFIESWIKTI